MQEQSVKILLGVTGGIAAYKAADLCSRLVHTGAEVRVVYSQNADRFIAPLVFEGLSGQSVYREVFDPATAYKMEHISWARWGDMLVIAPASADTLARMAMGGADDALTTLYLAFRGRVYVAPSMNTAMLEHPATQANLAILQERGVVVIAPGDGTLACGEVGRGRMAEPHEIMQAIGVRTNADPTTSAAPKDGSPLPPDDSLSGKTVLITSGPTREFLDPVRFISSPSSGRMGRALALDAARRGATVHFVTGPVDTSLLPSHTHCHIHQVQCAREMFTAVEKLQPSCDVLVFAAAVGDFRPAQTINKKIKRSGNSITLPLVENPDIAQAAGFNRKEGQVLIGFAAESHDHENSARTKLSNKRLDAIVLNDISNPAIGFGSAENEVTIVTGDSPDRTIPRASKLEIAAEVLQTAVDLLGRRREGAAPEA